MRAKSNSVIAMPAPLALNGTNCIADMLAAIRMQGAEIESVIQ